MRWTVAVTNTGPSVADDVTLTGTLPRGLSFTPRGSSPSCSLAADRRLSCAAGTLDVGETATFSVVTTIAPSILGRVTVTSTATGWDGAAAPPASGTVTVVAVSAAEPSPTPSPSAQPPTPSPSAQPPATGFLARTGFDVGPWALAAAVERRV